MFDNEAMKYDYVTPNIQETSTRRTTSTTSQYFEYTISRDWNRHRNQIIEHKFGQKFVSATPTTWDRCFGLMEIVPVDLSGIQ